MAEAQKSAALQAAVRFGGSAFILLLLFLFLPFDELLDALSRVPPFVWLICITVYLSLHLIGVGKWRMMMRVAGSRLKFVDTVRCYYLGLFGNTFFPSVIGGDIIRTGLAMRLASSRSGVALGSVVDRTVDSIGLAVVAGIGALLMPTALDEQSRAIFWGFAALAAVGGIVGLVSLRFIPFSRFPFKVRRILVKLRRSLRNLMQQPMVVIYALLLVVVLQTSLVVMNMLLGNVVGIEAPFVVWLFVWPLAKLSAMVPFTQGGIGVREAALAALFAPFGVSAVAAVAVGLVFQGVIIGGGLVGGLLAWSYGRLQNDSPSEALQS
jgi:uncharacterized membrane protein YbhN (UPF0104 family)